MVNDLLKRLGYGGATVLLVCLAAVIGLAVGSRINEANAATTDVMLWAAVKANGEATQSKGVVSTIKTPGTHGEYFLEFNRSVGSCAKLATIGSIDDGHISVLKGNTTTLIVHIKNDAGVFQDASFSVALIC